MTSEESERRDRTTMQITVGIITVSDRASRGEYDDLGGPALKERLMAMVRNRQNN